MFYYTKALPWSRKAVDQSHKVHIICYTLLSKIECDDASLELHQDRHHPERVVVAPLEAQLECLHEAIVVVGADAIFDYKPVQGVVAVLQVGLHALVKRGLVQSQI